MTTTRVPLPLTPPDCDLRAFRNMPFDVQRFRDSDLVTEEEPEVIVAAIMLWGASWQQVPAASLPNDDRALCKFAGYGRSIAAWHEVRDGALRGFVECSDGRLYHEVVAEKANEAWDKRLHYDWNKAKDRHRKAQAKLPEDERSDFVEFEDWKAGRTPVERPHRQARLPLENADGSTGRQPRAPAPARTIGTRTGSRTVPSGNSGGNDGEFQRNGPTIPAETALKGKEGNGIDSSVPIPTVEPDTPCAPAREDLQTLHAAVCEAAGYRPVSPTAIANSMEQVKDWRNRGLDFDQVVIPAIRAVVASSAPDDRTRTLGRFRHAIAREAAKFDQAKSAGQRHRPTQTPLLEPEGEDAKFRPMRRVLLERLGPDIYTAHLNGVRFEGDEPEFGQDRAPLIVRGPGHSVEHIVHGSYASVVRNAAASLGFTELWKR